MTINLPHTSAETWDALVARNLARLEEFEAPESDPAERDPEEAIPDGIITNPTRGCRPDPFDDGNTLVIDATANGSHAFMVCVCGNVHDFMVVA